MHQTDLEGVKCDDEFWADDVHIVLIAQGTAFRVRKECLAGASPVFADMFKNAQPGEETWDGCPMVRLSDSAVDLRRFLDVVVKVGVDAFEEDCNRHYLREQVECAVLTSVTRVAHKYQADRVLNAAAHVIEQALQYTPETQERCIGCPEKQADKVMLENKRVMMTLPRDAVEVVNIAHIINRPAWLPHALHLICGAGDFNTLRRGVTRDDGEVECLSDDDYARCKHAMPLLEALCCEVALRTYDLSSRQYCPRCQGVRRDRLLALARTGMRKVDILNFTCEGARYYRRDSTRELWLPDDELCHLCNGEQLEDVRALYANAVRKLPGCFALDREGKPVN